MPDKNYSLQTEYDYSSRTLIVDEIGELPTLLVDSLLSRGNFIYYFGKTKKEDFYYLLEKNNFRYCSTPEEVTAIDQVDYVYYFPQENGCFLDHLFNLPGYSSAKYIVCQSLLFARLSGNKDMVLDKKINIRKVLYDQVFGKRISQGMLGEIFSSINSQEMIILAQNQSQEISPVSGERLTAELPKILYASETQNKTYFLETPKITVSDFVNLIKKVDPDTGFSFQSISEKEVMSVDNFTPIHIDENLEDKIIETIEWFTRNKRNSLPVAPELVSVSAPLSVLPLTPDLTDKKSDVDFLFKDEASKDTPKNYLKQKAPSTRFKRKTMIGLFVFTLFILLFFGLPLLLITLFGLSGIKSLSGIPEVVNTGNLPKALSRTEKATRQLGWAQKIIFVSSPFYSLIGVDKPLGKINETLAFSQNISKTYFYSLSSMDTVQGWVNSLIKGEEIALSESVGTVKSNFSLAYQEASLAQLSLAKAEEGYRFLGKQKEYEEIGEVLPDKRDSLLKVQNFVSALSQILGTKDRKTYLVLLQNNLELRPTGGFISAYGVVNFENGKLISFEVEDVYQADNLLKGKVDPPRKINELLGETTWYLRDSNWEPDFPSSAQKAQWFLDKEIQLSTNGVIALNLTVFQKLLAIVGEVSLPDLPEAITGDNFWQVAQLYPEKTNFSSNGSKGDFVSLLTKAVWEKVKYLSKEKQVNLIGTLFELLDEKEILLYSNDTETQKIYGGLNWDGSIKKSLLPPRPNIIVDYLFINEANVGINKVNMDIKRKIEHQVALGEDGLVKEKLLISYQNMSLSENWPAGPYKNYLRLYLPDKVGITSVLVTDINNPQLWLPFDSKLIDLSSSYGKTEVGLFLEIPPKSERKIEISYELPTKTDFTEKVISYLLLLQKQSGISTADYNLVFSSPAGFVPLRVIPKALVSESKLFVSEKINKDFILQVDLGH